MLEDRLDSLKEYSIGVAVFDRPKHYNPAEDPIVRVEARRLRKKLDEFYGANPQEPVVIDVPKGGYLPTFEVRSKPKRPLRWPLAAGAGALAACCALGFWWISTRHAKLPELALTRLTSDHGLTTDPALSPDGSTVVYASDRDSSGGLDIWIQPVDSPERGGGPRRLTNGPADDLEPAISPDRSTVVFRSERQPPGIYVVAASGGD
ncbi:MAG TPA: hypothetical protein VKT80_03180, partial [Chloroflexota bacterium]|nr:hypothetical protein [Chloroflexota bacterium]